MDMYNLKQVPSEAQIRKYLRHILFGKNVFCPKCRSRQVISEKNRYWCKSCRNRFSLLSETWLSNMKLDLQKWWLTLWSWTTAIPVKQSMSLTHLSEKAIRHYFGLFRDHLPEEHHILERIIQLDEAFFKEHFLIMAKQKGSRKLAYEVIPGKHPQRHHAANFLFSKIKPGSQIWTDGAGIYQGVSNWWPVKHSRDIHRKFQFEHTSEIEGTFGNYRTFVRRMYHHHWSKNLPEYVREFCFRFSSPELFNNPLFYLSKSLKLATTG